MPEETVHRLPILVSIPHASPRIPPEVADLIVLSEHDLHHYTDLYTDRIFRLPNVHTVEYDWSRVVVDVNRAPDDISKEYELAAEGVTVHTTWDGRSVYKQEPSPELMEKLIKMYHDPYHEQIDAAIPHVQFLIDCHSFLPLGPKLKADSGSERPDINLGNVNYSSCSREHTLFFRDFFQDRGYSVKINFPYAGKYILGHHCHRRRIPGFLVPGIQIEINQGLYVNQNTQEPIEDRITEFQTLFKDLIEVFGEQFSSS